MKPSIHQLHAGIAESGKLLALQGRHQAALERYREALRMAQSAGAPQIFARHYLHCVLESLEHLGAHEQAAALAAEAAKTAWTEHPSAFQRRDRAQLLERQGMNLLKGGQREPAVGVLEQALEADPALELTRAVLGWLHRGYTLNSQRLTQAQKQHHYFTVRPDSVDARRAAAAQAIRRSGQLENKHA